MAPMVVPRSSIGGSSWPWFAAGSRADAVGTLLVGSVFSTCEGVDVAKPPVELWVPTSCSDVVVLAVESWAPQVL
jgi:hypothetical protein